MHGCCEIDSFCVCVENESDSLYTRTLFLIRSHYANNYYYGCVEKCMLGIDINLGYTNHHWLPDCGM